MALFTPGPVNSPLVFPFLASTADVADTLDSIAADVAAKAATALRDGGIARIVGAELEGDGERALASIYAATAHDVNPLSGKLELVVEPRLTGTEWYLMADPARMASMQYAYLSAAQGVQIQRQEAWDTLGMKFRAWLDFGCGWLDWRGAYRGAGG